MFFGKYVSQLMLLAAVFAIGVLVTGGAWWWMSSGSRLMFKSSSQVITKMQSLQRLETAQFTLETIIDGGTSGNQIQQLLFGDRILLIAHGEVIGGVDLSELTEKDVELMGTTLKITLPPTRVLVTTLDSEKTRVYDRKQGLLTKGNVNLETEARKSAESELLAAACEGGILTQAATNAQKELEQFFSLAGFTKVTVVAPVGSCEI
jgi:hypothetical protein